MALVSTFNHLVLVVVQCHYLQIVAYVYLKFAITITAPNVSGFKMQQSNLFSNDYITCLIWQMAMTVLGTLEQALGPRAVLKRALSVSSHILQQYVGHLVLE